MHILLTRLLTVSSYGIYIYVMNWCAVLVLAVKFGMDTGVVRFISVYNAKEKFGEIKGILLRGTQCSMLMSIGIAFAIWVVLWRWGKDMASELRASLQYAIFVMPIQGLIHIYCGALRGLKYTLLSRLPPSIIHPLFFSALIGGCVWLMDYPMDAPKVLLVYLLTSVMVLAIVVLLIRHYLPENVFRANRVYNSFEWLQVSFSLFLISSTYTVMNHLDTLMVGSLLGTQEAGIYSVASRVSGLILFGLNAVSMVVAPFFAEYYVNKRNKDIQRVVLFAGWGLAAFSLPVGLVLIVTGDRILSFFGAEYAGGFMALQILAVGQIVNALAGSVGVLMNMTGHERQAAWILVSSLGVNFMLNIFFIPRLGIEGAALATAISTVMWNACMIFFVWKYLKINTLIFLSWIHARDCR
jgi:O-antigen/teichoic acid export membrane protein